MSSVSIVTKGVVWRKASPELKLVSGWVQAQSLGIPRYGGDIFFFNNKIYIVGGETQSGITTAVEVVDLSTYERTYTNPMPDGRAYFCGVLYTDSKYYVIGGKDRVGFFKDTVLVFDPSTDTWSTHATTLPKKIANHSCVATVDGIYITGGLDDSGNILADTYLFDPVAGTVTAKSPMNTARMNHATAELNGKIYVFGGDNGTTALDSIEEYDPATDTWTVSSITLPQGMTGIRAVKVKIDNQYKIYITGG